MNGKMIVIDGTDGSGKGTQTKILVDKLKTLGFSVEFFDFPQYGTKSAGAVEEYLNGKYGDANSVGPYRASIFYAVDRYDASFKIKEALSLGKVVICNRYVSSNMGHQAGKIKDLNHRDEFLDWLQNLEYNIFAIPKPDLNILLYLDPKIGQDNVDKKGHRDYVGGQKKDIHEADLQHLIDASNSYLYVAKKYGWTIVDCADNGSMKSIENIHELVLEEVLEKLD